MKLAKIKTGVLTLLSVFFLITSCSKDNETQETTSADLSAQQEKLAADTDEATQSVLTVIESAYTEQEEESGRNTSLFSDCVTITISTENGVVFKTLDFGLGCELQNGDILSGKINITYGPIQNGTRTITYSFDGFVINDKGIEGGGTLYRERHNAVGNPQSTFHKNIVVTHPDGVVATINGTRVREWIEGVGSGTWVDNVILVTGNWSQEFSTGFTRSAFVTEALRREATCPFFVSGLVEVSRNDIDGELDYGDGTCDNVALLTVNGVEHLIHLHH